MWWFRQRRQVEGIVSKCLSSQPDQGHTTNSQFSVSFVHKEKSFPVQFADLFWITCGLYIVGKYVLECVQSSLFSDIMENKCMCSHTGGKTTTGVWYFLGVYKSIYYTGQLVHHVNSQGIFEKYSKNSTVACRCQSLWCSKDM